jgi:hypothetical protein
MTSHRMQHIVPGFAIFALAAAVTWLSFTEQPAEAFLFPRVISVVFIILAIWNLIRAVTGMSKVGRGIRVETLKNLAPGLAVMLLYVFFGAKHLGFYFGSTLAFFAIYSFYDPDSWSSVKDWIKRILVTAAFMTVIYALFAVVLQVHTPRGILF